MPRTGNEGEGHVAAFLVIEEIWSEIKRDVEQNVIHFSSAEAVEAYIKEHDEASMQGLDVPGLIFEMLIQSHDGGEPERDIGFWHSSWVGQTVYRGLPCKDCGKRDWRTRPNESCLRPGRCADCNEKHEIY